jgi:hypothetical protein
MTFEEALRAENTERADAVLAASYVVQIHELHRLQAAGVQCEHPSPERPIESDSD